MKNLWNKMWQWLVTSPVVYHLIPYGMVLLGLVLIVLGILDK